MFEFEDLYANVANAIKIMTATLNDIVNLHASLPSDSVIVNSGSSLESFADSVTNHCNATDGSSVGSMVGSMEGFIVGSVVG